MTLSAEWHACPSSPLTTPLLHLLTRAHIPPPQHTPAHGQGRQTAQAGGGRASRSIFRICPDCPSHSQRAHCPLPPNLSTPSAPPPAFVLAARRAHLLAAAPPLRRVHRDDRFPVPEPPLHLRYHLIPHPSHHFLSPSTLRPTVLCSLWQGALTFAASQS